MNTRQGHGKTEKPAGPRAGSSRTSPRQSGTGKRDGRSTRNLWICVWKLAGIAGVAPGPLTLRELIWMAEARSREAWNHTACMMALLSNLHRDPKKQAPRKPSDFHPLEEKKPVIGTADIGILKTVFIDGRK